jgi:hypothetical protein
VEPGVAVTRRSASGRCLCGAEIARGSGGRPRLSCSPRCRQRRDALLKQIERRRLWLLVCQTTGFTRDDAHQQAARLLAEIAQLEAALVPQEET